MSKIVRSVLGHDYTITKKGDLEQFYLNTGRYQVVHFEPKAGVVRLTITVPPKKVELLYFNDGETKSVAEEGQVIRLVENKEGGFECRVEVWITLL
ncbi:hypothetical protein NP493_420g00004 [Ridgeia piscesae]|uniref:Uncharacterized protein n=1 Tax=Ridgeia piscesae TaxID=27915 RepID=A0AAD9NSL3_RIDPI|nr:hypothetical protein NP493_420g00004 [Ridgeia piscesae]